MSLSIRQFKRKIQTIIDLLPFGVGPKLVMPVLRWTWRVFVCRKLFIDFRRKQIMRREAYRIQTIVKNKNVDKAIIVYDSKCTTLNYGEFLHFLLLARYLQAKNIFVSFYFVVSEYRSDFRALLSDAEIMRFHDEHMSLAKVFLKSDLAEIKQLLWSECKGRVLHSGPGTLIPFANYVLDREAIYNHCFNLINYLLANVQEELLCRVLFSYDQIKPFVNIRMPSAPYITWQVRYSTKWSPDRNITTDEFLRIFFWLSKSLKAYKIMIVSDFEGCNFFRRIAQKNNMELLFSKDYSQSFLEDAALVLKSDYFFQLRGGGIGLFPIYSLMPYTIICELGNELMWDIKRLTSWQIKDQIFIKKERIPLTLFSLSLPLRGLRFNQEPLIF